MLHLIKKMVSSKLNLRDSKMKICKRKSDHELCPIFPKRRYECSGYYGESETYIYVIRTEHIKGAEATCLEIAAETKKCFRLKDMLNVNVL